MASENDTKGKTEKLEIVGENIDFDIVLKEIGNCGRYQWLLIVFVYYICFTTGINDIGIVFLGAIPSHRCFIPGVDGMESYENVTENEILNNTVPQLSSGDYDSCHRYNYSYEDCTAGTFDCIETNGDSEIIACDDGYVYDKSIYESTLATEWDLVCDRLVYGSTSMSIYYIGSFFGNLVGANIADLVGRSPTMLVTQLGLLVTGICITYSPNLIVYTAIRFLQFVCVSVGYISALTFVIEMIASKWRTVIALTLSAPYCFGYMTLSGLAYNWRSWRELQFVIALCYIPFPIMWIFTPESPRWLLAKNRTKKGKKVCEDMARKNGKKLPENIWETASRSGENSEQSEPKYSPIELFRWPKMRIITLKLMFVWFSISMVYYGLSLNVANLSGNDYINNVVSACVELISIPMVMFTLHRYGRKPNLSIYLIMSGLFCLSSTLTNYYADDREDILMLGTALAILGKLGVSSAFAVIYYYAAELYPTVLRSTGIGVASVGGVLGSIFTPFAIQLQFSISWLTGTIFGVLSLLAGLVSLTFPETKGVRMHTTIEEAEEFYSKSKNRVNRQIESSENCHENEYFKPDDITATAL